MNIEDSEVFSVNASTLNCTGPFAEIEFPAQGSIHGVYSKENGYIALNENELKEILNNKRKDKNRDNEGPVVS